LDKVKEFPNAGGWEKGGTFGDPIAGDLFHGFLVLWKMDIGIKALGHSTLQERSAAKACWAEEGLT
jgi:hypothetical protein